MSSKLLCVTVLLTLMACASPPTPLKSASNQRSVEELVIEHLRAVESGDWAQAQGQLSQDFKMQIKGMPAWVSIPREDGLQMHKARKRAFPDFRFNEKIVKVDGNSVKVAVFLTGTHTGYLDYPIDEVPKLEATGKSIDLPAEYFTYYIERDKITYIYGEIPEGHGPPALKKQLGVSD